ncbi:MAG: prolipoprotein diacylglyceryl transferase [Deltaproteobacteria bacterium]|nr:MAG: prolipoprotein diacylglyceryl transferase [Deltaproteobacteria bacterium]
MHPVLINIPLFGGIKIYTYGLMYALAALTSIYVSVRLGKKDGYSPDRVMDLSFYLIIGNLLGARALYVITDWQRFADYPLDIFKIWEGGLVFFGGLIGAIATALYLAPRYKMKILKTADFFMPGLAFGHAIGRLGCLASGCCYGKPMPDFPFSITFPSQPYTLAPVGLPSSHLNLSNPSFYLSSAEGFSISGLANVLMVKFF